MHTCLYTFSVIDHILFQKSLRDSLNEPELMLTDFAKFDRPGQLHIAFQVLVYCTAYHAVCTVQRTMQFVLYSVPCSLYCTAYHAVCTVQHTMQCVLYSVPCSVYCTAYQAVCSYCHHQLITLHPTSTVHSGCTLLYFFINVPNLFK